MSIEHRPAYLAAPPHAPCCRAQPLEVGEDEQDVAVGSALWTKDGKGIFFTSSRDNEFLSLRYMPVGEAGTAASKLSPWSGVQVRTLTKEQGV